MTLRFGIAQLVVAIGLVASLGVPDVRPRR